MQLPDYAATVKELGSCKDILNNLSAKVLRLTADYELTGGRESLVSITLTHLKMALITAHAWTLEVQEYLKEQEDATV
ncbi:MAG TPA: hypothetical protein VM537_03895 [Anaerolineae bacterium]|nr:hypothetical protein [Anaerolineae bacterium]